MLALLSLILSFLSPVLVMGEADRLQPLSDPAHGDSCCELARRGVMRSQRCCGPGPFAT
jgi:hypothetical protein